MSQKNPNYGLIHLSQHKAKLPITRPAIFGDSSSDEEDETVHQRKPVVEQAKTKRQTQIDLSRALEDDPSVFEYDEVYDDMKNKKSSETSVAATSSKEGTIKQPKYVHNLLKHADERKKEQERRSERKIQKEREQEGDEFADKEAFVTSAYREKLKEREEWEEKEKKERDLEEKMDVTKQTDLSGFYRNLLNESVKPESEKNQSVIESMSENVKMKQSDRKQTNRQLRVRKDSSSDNDSDDGQEEIVKEKTDEKKQAEKMTNDEDEMIDEEGDSSSGDARSDSESEHDSGSSDGHDTDGHNTPTDTSRRKRKRNDCPQDLESTKPPVEVKKQKVDKLTILLEKFQKRTVDQVFEDAVQRYLQRKEKRTIF